MDKTAQERITKARAGLILDQPFFGSLALRLKMNESADYPTMATDGKQILYNPAFVAELNAAELKGVLCHEVMHCALGHQSRRGQRDHKTWNEAGDYAINGILLKSGVILPKDRLHNDAFDNMDADAIYGRLKEQKNQEQQKDEGQGEEGQGQEGNDPGRCGEVLDAPPGEGAGPGQSASPSELQASEQDWKIALSQAAQQAKAQGKLPAEIARLVKEHLSPKVDWKDVLRRFIQTTAKNDYRWTPPSRRYMSLGLYLPGLQSDEIPPIVVAIDTSGSIDDKTLAQFSAELNDILGMHQGTTCHVIYCDARVNRTERYETDDLPLSLKACGGGGTDYAPAFEHAEHELADEDPACMIYLTDGYCDSFPDHAPSFPVLWCIYGGYDGFKAPFGEIVKVE